MRTGQTSIAVSLALESLSEACEEVDRLALALSDARALRDDLIRDARNEAEVPYRKLIKITRLSQPQLYNIANKPPRES